MAYDEALAARVRALLGSGKDVTERKMFGGIGFFLRGNMGPGVMGSRLIVKMDKGPDFDIAMAKPHTAPFDFTGKPMRGILYVEPAGLAGAGLATWVRLSADYARSLPPKAGKPARVAPNASKAGRKPKPLQAVRKKSAKIRATRAPSARGASRT